MIKAKIVIIVLLFNAFNDLNAETFGSDLTVTRIVDRILLKDGDRVAGFAKLENGFKINSATSSAIFDSFFPVSGNIFLNGGTLVLNRDLILVDAATMAILGNVEGNNLLFKLSPNIEEIPGLTEDYLACAVFLITSTQMNDTVNSCDWAYNSLYLVTGEDSIFTTSSIQVSLFNGTALIPLAQKDPGGDASDVNSVRWHPSLFTFAMGRNVNALDELFTFSYDISTQEITTLSSDNLNANAVALSWHPSGQYLAVGSNNVLNNIYIYSVDDNGILNTDFKYTYTVSPSRTIQKEALDWDVTGSYLAVGLAANGIDSELMILGFDDSPALLLSEVASSTFLRSVKAVDWNKTYTELLGVGFSGNIDNRIVLQSFSTSLSELSTITGIADFTAPVSTINWHPSGNCLVVGTEKDDDIAHFRSYSFDHVSNFTFLTNDDFVEVIEAARYAPNGIWLATADDQDVISVRANAQGSCVTLSNINFVLTSDFSLKNCCIQFAGNCSVSGVGYTVTLDSTCQLIISSDSSLLLQDITLNGIQQENIQCTDNTGTVILNNAQFILADDFFYKNGAMQLLGSIEIAADGSSFIYQSDQLFSIMKNSTCILDANITFSYDPLLVPSKRLFIFEDNSSILQLNGATFHTTVTGIEFNKGLIVVKQDSSMSSEFQIFDDGTNFEGGITFGDGVNISNDTKLIIEAATNLNLESGSFIYNNLNSNYIKMFDFQSAFVVKQDARFIAMQNLSIPVGFLTFNLNSYFLTKVGIQVEASLNPRARFFRKNIA